MYTPERSSLSLDLVPRTVDKMWGEAEKVGKVTLDPETKWLIWDSDMRARALGVDQLSEEGKASLDGQTFFGTDKEVECVKWFP